MKLSGSFYDIESFEGEIDPITLYIADSQLNNFKPHKQAEQIN